MELNNASLYEALVRCNNNKNYKAVIVFSRRADVKDFAEELAEIHRYTPIPGVCDMAIYGSGTPRINFKNGSRVELITLAENARAIKCNEVICESEIDIEDQRVRGLLQCMLVPYRRGAYNSMDGRSAADAERMIDEWRKHERNKEVDQRSEELDEFLGSFSINE